MGILNRTKGINKWLRNKGVSNNLCHKVIRLYQQNNELKLGQEFTNRIDSEKELIYHNQFVNFCNWFIRNKDNILSEVNK